MLLVSALHSLSLQLLVWMWDAEVLIQMSPAFLTWGWESSTFVDGYELATVCLCMASIWRACGAVTMPSGPLLAYLG